MEIEQQSVLLVKNLFHFFWEERKFGAVSEILSEDASWIGIGNHEIYNSKSSVIEMLNLREELFNCALKIIDENYNVFNISMDCCIVYGELKIAETGFDDAYRIEEIRYSILCSVVDNEVAISHLHISSPNSVLKDTTPCGSVLPVEDDEILLKKKLYERTLILNDKAASIEALVTNISGGIQICRNDYDFSIIYLNNGFYKLTGFTKEEIEDEFHNKQRELIFEEDADRVTAEFYAQLNNSNGFSLEYRMKHKDNKLIWVLDKGLLVTNADGKIQIQHILTDVTSQKLSAEFLKTQSAEMRTIYDNVNFAILKCDLSGTFKIYFMNPTAYRLLGYTKEQFKDEVDSSALGFICSDDLPEIIDRIGELKRTGVELQMKMRLVRRDKQIIIVSCCGNLIKAGNGEQMALYTFQDITEDEVNRELLIRSNTELKISERRYEIALSNISDIVFDYIVETKQLVFMPADVKKYNIPMVLENGAEAIVDSGFIHKSSVNLIYAIFEKIDNGGESAQAALLAFNNSEEVIIQITLTNIFDENKKPIRAIGVIADLTGTVNLEREERYREAMTVGKVLTYEANITRDSVTSVDDEWSHALGIDELSSYSEMMEFLAGNMIHKDYCDKFRGFASRENIEKCLLEGRSQVVVEYRRRNKYGEFSWIKNRMNIIRDLITDDIKIRCYINIIDQQKEKEIKANEEQRFYEVMVSKAALVYEADLTNNLVLRGHEEWDKKFGIMQTTDYDEMIGTFIKKTIHPDDRTEFARCFSRTNLIACYEKDIHEQICEYRRANDKCELTWFSCAIHLFEDPISGTTKAFFYVQDINEEKQNKLELIYRSEHDSLTEIFNRGTTEQKVEAFLETSEGKTHKHAFFLFDIDHFKDFNDNFGHSFGDAVLSQTARKVKNLFRDEDIVGRIGGDEFVILMKNIPNREKAFIKANEICNAVRASYSQKGKNYKVSVSVGISICDEYTKCSYVDIYNQADTALYIAKESGRDRYISYESGMTAKTTSINEMRETEIIENRAFYKNMSDYVFRILYESADKIVAINSVLELIGKQYNVSRAYIFEDSEDGRYSSNTFEWCADGIIPAMNTLEKFDYSIIGDHQANFNENGIFFLPDLENADDSYKQVLSPQAVKSMLHFSIKRNAKYVGFVGYDQCDRKMTLTSAELTELRNISSILGVFVIEMRFVTQSEAAKNVILTIVNALNSYAYVVDKDTYQLLFINDMTRGIAPTSRVGNKCFSAFFNRSEPCKNCPLEGLRTSNAKRCTREVFNDIFNVWTRATASWIEWESGVMACLLDCVDITKYISE